jgi:pimeloyl-ACP methyl ester carboxylesterase
MQFFYSGSIDGKNEENPVTTLPWHERLGTQRDWIWRGWQTRYTCVRAQTGDLPPLILLHGFGASIGNWRHNLSELGQHHTVYALDMLGFGASEKASAPFGVELWVAQLYDFWRLFVRRPVVLVGNSLGSLVCLAAAATHPEMVQGIVMINLPDSSVLELPAWAKKLAAAAGWASQPLVTPLKWLLTSPLVFNPFFWLIRSPRLIRLWAKQAYALPASITDEVVEIFSLPAFDRGAARTLRAIVNAKTRSRVDYSAKTVLPTLQIPLLLFWGQQDKMVPPKLAPLFLNYNPNLKLIQIENAGHCPHDECPERVNREILAWIANHVA